MKNTVKDEYSEILLQTKITIFYFNIFKHLYIFLWCKSEFSEAITPVFSVTWSFRNHSNILWKPWLFFQESLMNKTFWSILLKTAEQQSIQFLVEKLHFHVICLQEFNMKLTRSRRISWMRFLAESIHSLGPLSVTLSLHVPVRGKLTATPPYSSASSLNTCPLRQTKWRWCRGSTTILSSITSSWKERTEELQEVHSKKH